MNSIVRIALAAALAVLGACAPARRAPPHFTDADYPGTLQPAAALPRDVLWQQRVTASWGDEAPRGFDAALQRQGRTLTLIGLTPLGSTGFVVRLDGDAITFSNDTGEDLPFPPRFILLDVERVFFPWLPAAAGDAARGTDAARETVVGDELVVEVVVGGRLAERRFTRLDGKPAGTITVRYAWDRADWLAPTRAVLDNGWFGYRLTIDTLAETLLPPAAAPPEPAPPAGG